MASETEMTNYTFDVATKRIHPRAHITEIEPLNMYSEAQDFLVKHTEVTAFVYAYSPAGSSVIDVIVTDGWWFDNASDISVKPFIESGLAVKLSRCVDHHWQLYEKGSSIDSKGRLRSNFSRECCICHLPKLDTTIIGQPRGA